MAASGLCSRRAAEAMIKAGRVRLNGGRVELGTLVDPAKDVIVVDGERLMIPKKQEFVYIMLNKPRGYVTTSSDELGRKTVMDLLSGVNERIYPVGRLDRDSEGLLLLTNDGTFANQVTHPRHGVSKLYRATVRPQASEEQVAKLASGVTLDDGSRTMPAMVHVLAEGEGRSVLEISIKEGRNRQIRRMCEAVGLEVSRLRRNALGPLKLGMLKAGAWRMLTTAEVKALRSSALRTSKK